MTDQIINPGDHIVIESSTFRDSYDIVRVVKVSKLMWEVEQLRSNGEYDLPARRKVGRVMRYTGNDPHGMAKALSDTRKRLWDAERALRHEFHASIAALPGLSLPPSKGQ